MKRRSLLGMLVGAMLGPLLPKRKVEPPFFCGVKMGDTGYFLTASDTLSKTYTHMTYALGMDGVTKAQPRWLMCRPDEVDDFKCLLASMQKCDHV